MERTGDQAKKITLAVAATLVFSWCVLPSRAPAAPTLDGVERALVIGRADPAWVAKAAALATADARAAARLGRDAEATNLPPGARDRALAALAQAGTPEAQQALRAALASPAVARDAAYPLLVARLADVRAPTVETVTFLAETHAAAVLAQDRELAFATQHTLDAAWGHRLTELAARRTRQGRHRLAHQR